MNRQQRRAAARRSEAPSHPSMDAQSAARMRISSLFGAAVARHQAGGLVEAEALYREILAIDPDHAHSHHHLGVLAFQIGRSDIAEAMIGRAIALNGREPAFHSNLGNALKELGRLDEAVAAYRRALVLKPDFADAHNNLGAALAAGGDLDAAAAAYRRALALSPGFADAHKNLGNALRDQGKLDEAAAAYRRALAIKPDHADSANNLGVTLKDQGKLDQAIEVYRQALAGRPDYADAHSNLGNALRDRGRLDEAIAACRQALVLRPDHADAHNNLANALRDHGQLDEAEASYRRALAIKPDFVDGYNNLGGALASQGRLDEALSCFARLIALKPDSAEAHSNLGNLFKDLGRFEEAIAAFRRALALKPRFAEAHSNLLFTQHYMSGVSNAELLAEARRYGAGFEGLAAPRYFDNDRSPERRLRIGYVSADFHSHPVGFLLAGVLEAHDPAAVEVTCYTNRAKADPMTERLRRAATHWRSIIGATDADAAAMIRADRIDILVDLSGHTAMNRLPLFALRPAPVQASWLGYFGTTGLKTIDYLLMDEATVPRGEERWYAEAVVRLPHGRFCYAPPAYAPAPVDPPSLRGEGVTFGSFNNIAKLGPEVVELWAATLRATPNSRLLLKWNSLDDAGTRRRLADAFAAAGIAGDRLELRGHSPHPDMLAQYGDVDVALDPFPFGGGMTSCEALWMGVPVVTLPGDRPASRQTLGFLHSVGLEDCVAHSPNDYVRRAVSLAADRRRLAALRHGLRERMAASPLCNGAHFAPTLETAFREMWRRWRDGEAAASFDAPANAS